MGTLLHWTPDGDTYYRRVPGGCPGYGYPARSLDEACRKEHVLVGDAVYHVEPSSTAMWRRVQERVARERAADDDDLDGQLREVLAEANHDPGLVLAAVRSGA